MRALTLWQPYASLVAAGIKPVENRTWPVPSTVAQFIDGITYVPGGVGTPADPDQLRIAIHAGQSWDFGEAAMEGIAKWRRSEELRRRVILHTRDFAFEAMAVRGSVLGTVLVTGCHKADECLDASTGDLCSPWAGWRRPDRPFRAYWHWTFADPVALDEPIPMRGRQGLWTVPDDVLAEVPA